jgi:hypothetical protein
MSAFGALRSGKDIDEEDEVLRNEAARIFPREILFFPTLRYDHQRAPRFFLTR